MKLRILLVCFLLIIQVNSYLIHVKEASYMKKAKALAVRRFNRVLSQGTAWDDMWEAIKNIFNKQDFRLETGVELSISLADMLGDEAEPANAAKSGQEKVDLKYPLKIPLSISLFHESNAEEVKNGCKKALDTSWCYKFKPSSASDFDLSEIKDQMTKKILKVFASKTTEILSKLAEVMACSLITKMFKDAVKHLIALIFPPLGILVTIYEFIETVINFTKGLTLKKQEGSETLYELKYEYEIDLAEQLGISSLKFSAFVLIVINLGKLKEVLTGWLESAKAYITQNWEQLKIKFDKATETAEQFIKTLGLSVQKACSRIGIYLSQTVEKAKVEIGKLKDKALEILSQVKQAAKDFYENFISQKIFQPIKNLGKKVQAFFSKLKNVFSSKGGRRILLRLAKNQISYNKAFRSLNRRFFFNLY